MKKFLKYPSNKKTVEDLITTNNFLVMLTLGLYLTLYAGLLFQFILLIYQIILSIYLLVNFKFYTDNQRKLLISYWLIIFVFGSIHFIGIFDFLAENWIVFYAVLPMSIIFFFSYILEIIRKQYEKIT